jgi:hypothetical protein
MINYVMTSLLSGWKSPNHFLTVVSLCLLVLGSGVLVVGIIAGFPFLTVSKCSDPLSTPPSCLERDRRIGFTIIGVALAVTTPSIVGAVLLLRNNKKGFALMMVCLALWSFIIIYGMFHYYAWYSGNGVLGWAIAISFLGFIVANDTLFLIGVRSRHLV